MTNEEYKIIEDLAPLCKPVEAFSFEGVTFIGYWPEVLKEYAKNNPSDKFFIWLQNNYQMVIIENEKT
jgi:hypothetical protein